MQDSWLWLPRRNPSLVIRVEPARAALAGMSVYDPNSARKRMAARLLRVILSSGLSKPLARPDLPGTLDPTWWDTWFDQVAIPQLGSVVPAAFRLKSAPERLSSLLVNDSGTPVGFVKVRRRFEFGESARALNGLQQATGFRVPRVIEWGSLEGYHFLLTTPLPRGLTHPARLSNDHIASLVDEFRVLLRSQEPTGTQSGWVASHGDLARANLRRASDGSIWLLDFDDFGWGPKLADWVLFVLDEQVNAWGSDRRRAKRAAGELSELGSSSEVLEAIRFWVEHPRRVLHSRQQTLLLLLSEHRRASARELQ